MKKDYFEYILSVDGMMCGMCEAHVNNLLYKRFPFLKKVKSSARKGTTLVRSPQELSEEDIRSAFLDSGYIVKEIHAN